MSRNDEERLQKLEKAVNKANVELYSGDLNEINTTKIVYAGAGATNKPGSGGYGVNNGYCITLFFMEGYKKQIYYLQNANNYSYERTCNNGVWTEWIEEKELLDTSKIKPIVPTHEAVSNYQGYGNSYYYKVGSRVYIHIGIKVDTTNSASFFTLPEGYRPYKIIYAVGVGASLTNTCGFMINALGGIAVHSPNGYGCVDIEYDAVS